MRWITRACLPLGRSSLLLGGLVRAALPALACVTLCGLASLSGCKRLRGHDADQYVYVVSKGTFLRDRVAAVSNKVADIKNGDRLTVLQHGRRFLQVKTAAGKVGWLEEHAVVDQAEYDKFEALKAEHAKDPVVATAILRDELYLHLTSGRKTEHLFLLPENDKLQLLLRASVEKPLPPQGMPTPKAAVRHARPVPRPGKPVKRAASGSTIWAAAPTHPDPYSAPDLEPPDKPLEDWWLVRDQGGHVGWVLARRLDVDISDQVAQYSEGHKIVGAYQLNTVYDPGGPAEDDEAKAARKAKKAARLAREAAASGKKRKPGPPAPEEAPVMLPGRQVPQFVTVTQEYKDGLPYDWDQVRVFIWNTHKHRYETAYRLREQQGYMPVTIGQAHFKDGSGRDMGLEPTFTIRTTPDGVVTQDPVTGAFHPKTLETTTYRLEGGIVRRADPPPPPAPKAEVAPAGPAPTGRPAAPVKRSHAQGLRQPQRRSGVLAHRHAHAAAAGRRPTHHLRAAHPAPPPR